MSNNNPGNKCYTYRGLKFYAKNGFICLHDEENGDFFVLSRKDFLERARALSREAKRLRDMSARNPTTQWLVQDRLALQQAIENMLLAIRDAKEQGDRNDPAVAAWFAKHRPHKRSRVSLSSGANFILNVPGDLPVGKFTGREAKADFSVGSAQPKRLILPGEF